MNFFEHQDAARRQSKRLIVLFVLAVVGIVVSIDVGVLFALGFARRSPSEMSGMLVLVTIGTLAVIGISSLARWRRQGRAGTRRDAGRRGHHRFPVPSPAQCDRGNCDCFWRARTADLRDGTGGRHQRVRVRLGADRRSRHRHPRCARPSQPRRTAGRDRARIQPCAQWRHAPEPAPDRRAVRHPGARHHRPQGTVQCARRPRFERPGPGPDDCAGDPDRRLCRRVLRPPDQGRCQPPARIPRRRLGGAVHAPDHRHRRRAEESRRAGRWLEDRRRRRRGDEPHVLRRRRRLFGVVRDPPATGQAHQGAGSILRRKRAGRIDPALGADAARRRRGR